MCLLFPARVALNPRHLKDNLKALEIHLTKEQVETLDSAWPFDYGFPMTEVSCVVGILLLG